MRGAAVGREKLLEEERKPLEELLGELERNPCLATENEQVGEACSTSKHISSGRFVSVFSYHMAAKSAFQRSGLKAVLEPKPVFLSACRLERQLQKNCSPSFKGHRFHVSCIAPVYSLLSI